MDVRGSCVASSPARSDESSAFLYHSIRASWNGRIATPARNGRFWKPIVIRMMAMVVYVVWPLMM